MSVAKISEITSISKKSFDDAIESGVKRACKTLRNVKSAWVKNKRVLVEKDRIVGYQVSLKVTFILKD